MQFQHPYGVITTVNYGVHLRICTRLSLLSILQVVKNWVRGWNKANRHTYITMATGMLVEDKDSLPTKHPMNTL